MSFGIFDMWGLWFIRGNLLRDLASLNKVELLPRDCWSLVDTDNAEITPNGLALLDQVAALTAGANEIFSDMQELYEQDDRLRVPPIIRSYTANGAQVANLKV